MTGVVVTTSTLSGSSSPNLAPSGQFFVVGLTERGPINTPTVINSLADYVATFGNRVTYGTLYDQLTAFFNEGGAQAVVVRAVGSTASAGSLTLVDKSGSSLSTLKVDAANPGDWSSRITVTVLDGTVDDTYRIQVSYGGTLVHDWNNLSTPNDAVQKSATSPYVRISDLVSASSSPNNQPTAISNVALSAGNDQRGSVVAATYVAKLDYFTEDFGDGAVAIPGQSGATIWDGITAHCEATNVRIGILADVDNASAVTLAGDAASVQSEYVGIFAPWVTVPSPAGQVRISPEGYVAAARNRAHSQVGPWRVPAGEIAIARYVTGLGQSFTKAEADALNTAGVSVIRVVNGTIRLYGWRSLSPDTGNYYFLKDRDLLNNLVYESSVMLEQFIDLPIDGKGNLLAQVKNLIVGMVDPIAQAGGLFGMYAADGTEIDPGYLIDVSANINPVSALAQNEIHVNLYVRISPAADLVLLNIIKVPVTSSF